MTVLQARPASSIILSLLLIANLWDFYHPLLRIRIFDFLLFGTVIFMCLVTFLQKKPTVEFDSRGRPHILAVSILIVASCLVALFTDAENYRSAIGIILSLSIFLFFYKVVIDEQYIFRSMNILLVINIAFLLFQYLIFVTSGQVFNPFEFLGIDVRLTGGNVFRPAGLFREPASFALMIFSFIVLKLRVRPKLDLISWTGIGAIFLSLSLWGALASVLLIVFLYWRSAVLHVLMGLSAFLVVIFWDVIVRLSESVFLLNRLLNIQEDGSAVERYGIGDNILRDPVFWFGHGPSTDNYQYFGGNGLGYMLATWGVIGGALIFALLVPGIPKGKRSISIFGAGLGMAASAIWTQAYWWVWMALLFKPRSPAIPGHRPSAKE